MEEIGGVMHNYTINGVAFNFNSDFSGDLHILKLDTKERIEIPASAVLHLVAHYVRNEKIAVLEQYTTGLILGTREPAQ